MTFAGLTLGQMATLFGILGGGMVLLYILKLRRRRIQVPFSPLWARVVTEKQSSSLFRRLKRLFSLLVQLVVLALVIGALGDPKLSGLGGCTSDTAEPPPPRHTLVLIDASASMATVEAGGKTRLALAKEKAREVVDSIQTNPHHRMMIVQLDATTRPRSLWSSSHDALLAAIDAVAPNGALDTPTGVDAALALAEDALRGRAHRETVLITDRAFAPIAPDRAQAVGLSIIGVGEAADNVGIQAFNVRPYLDDSLSYAIFYRVHNDSDVAVTATLFLYANDDGRSVDDFLDPSRIVESVALALPARGSAQGVIDNVKFPGSRLAARVALPADATIRDRFARDDVAFALVPERRRVAVQLVTEGNLFLNATLFVRENVIFEAVAPADYTGPGDFDLTIVDGAAVDMTQPGNYFVLNPQPGGPFEIDGVVSEPRVARTKKQHPLLHRLKLVDLNIAEMPRITPAKGDVLVAQAAGGAPLWMTRGDAAGQRHFVVLAFDIRKSLLPMSYTFPLLIVNVINYFNPEAAGLLQPNRAGVELSLASTLVGDPTATRGPTDAAPVHARRVADRMHLEADRIGIYEIEEPPSEAGGAPSVMAVAVNLMSAEESRVAPRAAPMTPWQAPAAIVVEDDPWLSSLWRILLLAALGVIVLEWLAWHRRVTV